ncbi:hypothetical protein NX794_03780 [Streptomyces sp. LP11]|uniref:Uncharacterized protein n=1 Tax=Streptomyces pyxinicus TaxID=2970331 RepID=A0ABT2AVS8_9ACTN|nr:hypothetical protein [Streptomyces sp. LP11]MCS0600354.1 hypothetical protein [Streptomyces sp. LP11]
MTQSGQGEEPSERNAREGVVLPSDGSAPLLPGQTGTPAPAAPAGGQAWGGSWGPEQQQPRDARQGQGRPPAAAPQWGGPGAPANPGPLPPEGAPAPSYGGGQAAGQAQYGGVAPQPGYGAPQPGYGAPQPGYSGADPYQQPYQQQPQPHQQQAYPQQSYPQQPYQQQPYPQEPYPVAGGPLPPTADGATQYIPPVPSGPADEGATQYLPPVPAAPADEGATQYLPPVTGGALPPESAGEETRYLGHRSQQQQQPQAQAQQPGSADAEATQYLPPYAGQAQDGERQPPAEFDNLFRGPGGEGAPAGSTQQLPRVPQSDTGPARASYTPAGPSHNGHGGHGGHGGYDDYDAGDDGGRRGGRSKVPLIAAVGVVIVALGLGAGALLSGGGDKKAADDGKTVSATSPAAGESSAAPDADPARQQAVALDKLLGDSGSSRASVIQAVADVKQCDNLDQAAGNLRDAAKQRGRLVTRLGQLTVDKLPSHGELTAALTKAWQASAAADDHYAAWAGQAKNQKVCRKGHARTTGETQAGNRESGTASAQKAQAAQLWNAIAREYGLTQRQPTQL